MRNETIYYVILAIGTEKVTKVPQSDPQARLVSNKKDASNNYCFNCMRVIILILNVPIG